MYALGLMANMLDSKFKLGLIEKSDIEDAMASYFEEGRELRMAADSTSLFTEPMASAKKEESSSWAHVEGDAISEDLGTSDPMFLGRRKKIKEKMKESEGVNRDTYSGSLYTDEEGSVNDDKLIDTKPMSLFRLFKEYNGGNDAQ